MDHSTPPLDLRAILARAGSTLLLCLAAVSGALAGEPIRLHPANPHYFLFRARPTVLITSTEHYGAVLNLDFHFIPYLDELHARGFNLTRLFSGTYREAPSSFGIRNNTLAPAPEHYLCPWARSTGANAARGGSVFDLQRWDARYFERLKQFVSEAGTRGIVVELSLFCPLYEDVLWKINPMNARNNSNGIGNVPRFEVYTLKHPSLLAVQDAVVRKVVAELKDFDNLYYEVCNEPYFGGVTAEWQDHIIGTIVDAERRFPAKHLIAQNIANGSATISRPNPATSIFNFHYARPPESVRLNAHLNKAIGDDETGFKGSGDAVYRIEGWEFILAGGAVYDNLDYSFTAGHENGTAAVSGPGGGGPALRKQLKVLKDFMESLDFVKMTPDRSLIRGGVPAGGTARALAEAGKGYAIYLSGGSSANLLLDLPAGSFRVEWVDPKTGDVARAETIEHPGGRRILASPPYAEDVALRLKRSH